MGRMEKFCKFGYNLSLPDTHEMNLIIKKALENKLVGQDKEIVCLEIAKVYNSELYQEAFEKVKESLEVVEKTFGVFEHYKKEWGFKIFEEYLIKITLFGPAGSYYHEKGKFS